MLPMLSVQKADTSRDVVYCIMNIQVRTAAYVRGALAVTFLINT